MAVIGTGNMGAQHARNLAAGILGARLVALADPDEDRVRQLGRELGVPHVHTDYRAVLERDDVEAVVIAAPSPTRAEMVPAAARAGKAVFCEKPAAVDAAAARRIASVLAETGVPYQMGFMRRFDPSYAHAKRRIAQGVIGEPMLVRVSSREKSPRPDRFVHRATGMFVESSIHDFDLAQWLMDDRVVRVYAQGAFVYPQFNAPDDVDMVTVSLTFSRGGLGLHDNMRYSGYGYHIQTEVIGTEGVLQIGAVHRDACVLLKQGHQASEYVVDWLERFRDAYILEMQHFVDCLRQGTTPAIGIDAGIRALEVAEACIESFKTGLPVDVPHVPDVPDVLGEGRR